MPDASDGRSPQVMASLSHISSLATRLSYEDVTIVIADRLIFQEGMRIGSQAAAAESLLSERMAG